MVALFCGELCSFLSKSKTCLPDFKEFSAIFEPVMNGETIQYTKILKGFTAKKRLKSHLKCNSFTIQCNHYEF